ncbi:dihydroneopterin aldolase [Verrucomicrobiales bacterium]|nr:dihydroneopterin aldolase [Verrucomicrobiales bacterium]
MPNLPPDTIHIDRLRCVAHIGVPAEERAHAQTLEVSLAITPESGSFPAGDTIADTIDYHAVSLVVRATASGRPRQLIETLAQDVAASILEEFPVAEIQVEVRKFILVDNPGGVAVRITRRR